MQGLAQSPEAPADDDGDDTILGLSSTQGDSAAPWCKDFDGYLYSKDRLGEMSIIEW
jgi:hypothetical protein